MFYLYILGYAQDVNTRTHEVCRGESIEFIATKYGVTVSELEKYNPQINTYFYVGQRINIPVKTESASQINVEDTTRNVIQQPIYDQNQVKILPMLMQAIEYEDNKRYSKAQKIYTKILEIDNSATYQYLSACCYFKDENWKKAIKKFELILSDKECDKDIREKTKILLPVARKRRATQLNNRARTWGQIGVALLATTATIATSTSQSNNTGISSYGNPSSYNTIHSSPGNMDYLLNPNYAIQQVQQQNWNEYLMMTDGGKSMSYQKYNTLKAQAYAEAQKSGSSVTSSSSSSLNKSKTTSSTNHTCSLCHGTGTIVRESGVPTFGLNSKEKCKTCGEVYWSSTGHSHVTCTQCRGKGHW